MTEEQRNPEDEVDWSQLEDLATDHKDGFPEPTLITPDMLAIRMLWDVIPCNMVEDVAKYIGLPPTSEEVLEKDHVESHARVESISPLGPFIYEMAKHATQSVVAGTIYATHEQTGSPLLDAEEREEVTVKTFPLVYQSAVAVISELVSLGVLHLPHYDLSMHLHRMNEEEDGTEPSS